MLKSVELFTGAGGLAVGAHLAGFLSEAFVERDKWACDTLRENSCDGIFQNLQPGIFQGDVRDIDWSSFSDGIDLVMGGPPCQPFSLGGKHKGNQDNRDMFPEMIRAIREIKPRAFVVENVKGLTRPSFANYYQYILLRLRYPDFEAAEAKSHLDNLRLLQKHATHNNSAKSDSQYSVMPTLVNSADYGIPQKRERLFIVGFRKDIDCNWAFPARTHSRSALLYHQLVSGAYWKEHGMKMPPIPKGIKAKLDKIAVEYQQMPCRPWQTVRDALAGLGEPQKDDGGILNHKLQAGAKSYKGHTGSPLDMPAKALKAGVHGVPGGENMLVKDDGSVRYFSIREAARIQTFPDGYKFNGTWTEAMRQLGNAVPAHLARIVLSSVARELLEFDMRKLAEEKTSGYPRLVANG